VSAPVCECGSIHPLHLTVDRSRCCWCWVVEDGKEPNQSHDECCLSIKRLEPIRVRFKTAVSAENEGCVQVLLNFRNPLAKMPKHIISAARKDPERVLRAIADNVVASMIDQLRSRVSS